MADSYAQIYSSFQDGDRALAIKLLRQQVITKKELESVSDKYHDTLLHLASRHGWYQLLRILTEEKWCDPQVKNYNGETPLHCACQCGHLNIVKYLVSIIKRVNIDQELVLRLTCRYGHPDILVYLIDKKGFKHRFSDLLNIACEFDHVQVVQYLWQATARKTLRIKLEDFNRVLSFFYKHDLLGLLTEDLVDPEMAFNAACDEGHTSVVKYLVEKYGNHCDINAVDVSGFTPVEKSVKHHNFETLKYLLSRPECDMFILNPQGNTMLHFAWNRVDGVSCCILEKIISSDAWSDPECMDIIEQLVSTKKWDPNSTCNLNDDTALHLSMQYQRYEVVKYLLLEINADLNCMNIYGKNPLDLMLSQPDVSEFEIIEILKSIKQWDPNLACNSDGDTVLHLSASCYKRKVAHFLLSKATCDPRIQNNDGAAFIGLTDEWSDSDFVDILNVLIEKKQWDPNSSCNSKGDTVLHLSAYHFKPTMTLFLLSEVGCNPNIMNNEGKTFFHILFYHWPDLNCIDVIKTLMAAKQWDPNSRVNSNGETILHLSANYYKHKVAFFLLSQTECDPCIRNNEGKTFIELIASEIHKWKDSEFIAVLKPLIETKRWDPNSICNTKGDTVLHLSTCFSKNEVALFLISKTGCDLNSKNNSGVTFVHAMLTSRWSDLNCIEVFKALISSKRWDSNSIIDSIGNTALHLSVSHKKSDLLQFLLSEAGCDPNVMNDKSKTFLDMVTSSWSDSDCIDIIKTLVATKHWGPNSRITNTSLHFSATNTRLQLAQFLLSKAGCNPNVKNSDGETFLNQVIFHWPDSYCTDLINTVIATKQWDPNSVLNSTGDTALHVSVRSYKPKVTEILLSEARCDPNNKNYRGETILSLIFDVPFGNSDCIYIIKTIVQQFKRWKPDSVCNSKGDTVLHLSLKHQRPEITRFLLSEIGCNPNTKNKEGERPLQLVHDSTLIIDFIRHGANPENVYKSHGKHVGLKKPLSPPVKVFIVGNSGVGKSTLTKALKTEALPFVKAFRTKQHFKVCDVDQKTAGVVPHDFVSRNYGCVIFHDFAGHREFYGSHAKFLQDAIHISLPIFLVVIKLNEGDKTIKDNILYWLSFLQNYSDPSSYKPHLIIVGSHADVVLQEGQNPQDKAAEISNLIEKEYQATSFEYKGTYTIDCQFSESSGMSSLRRCLKESCKDVRIPKTITFNAHCFHLFLLYKFGKSVAVFIQDIRKELLTEQKSKKVTNYLPKSTLALCTVCEELHDRGHIIFLKNSSELEDSCVIIDKKYILAKVTGTVFAPKDFKQHCQLAIVESTGVVPLSRLEEHFSDIKSTVLVGCLSHLDFCHEIKDVELQKLCKEHLQRSVNRVSENERFFLFPGLITQETPSNLWEQNIASNFKHYFGWMLQCPHDSQIFNPQFLQILLLKLAFSFPLVKNQISAPIPALQRNCSIWRNGIFWGEIFGMETIVEVHSKTVILLIRYNEDLSHCVAQRSHIIRKILMCAQELCPKVKTVESLIDPSEITTFPLKAISNLTRVSLQAVSEAIVADYESLSAVSSSSTMPLTHVLKFEPYAEMRALLIKELYRNQDEKISDQFLQMLSGTSSNILRRIFLSRSSVSSTTSESMDLDIYTLLQGWREKCDGTYRSLKEKLDQFSIFGGRNIFELSRVPFMPEDDLDSAVFNSDIKLPDCGAASQNLQPSQSTSCDKETFGEEAGAPFPNSVVTRTIPATEPGIPLSAEIAPKLHQLDHMHRNGKTVKIINTVAAVWDRVALRLHFEGCDIARIARDHHQQVAIAATTVFTEWLDGKGRQPPSWTTLITALKEMKLIHIVNDLECILGINDEPQEVVVSPSTSLEPSQPVPRYAGNISLKVSTATKSTDGTGASGTHEQPEMIPERRSSLPQPEHRPNLSELQLLKGRGGRKVKIIEEVGGKWKDLARSLNFSESRIDSIDTSAPSEPEEACRRMLNEWLDGDDDDLRGPVTWDTLIQSMMDAGLMDIADRLSSDIHDHLYSKL